MKTFEKWADRLYTETDFGRSIATSVAGVIGLIIYLYSSDWVIGTFSSIISFPIIRLVSTTLHERLNRRKKWSIEKEEAEHIYNHLSEGEKTVVETFVKAGGSVLTFSQMNNQPVASASVESLIHRKIIWTSMTADGMRETFVLDSTIFDIGNQRLKSKEIS
ncbi:MAG: hypothetical protein GF353_22480 [Candidatus Lokiarchaeota archaeon]|nr:hypothetical protein [Candidatus Lokiarchaeota archaeon]